MWQFAIAMHKPSMDTMEAQKLWTMLEYIDRVTTDHIKRHKPKNEDGDTAGTDG